MLANAASGAQLYEHLAAAVHAATNMDSKDAITRTALVIFVVMLAAILISGVGLVLPNLVAIELLQAELIGGLLCLPLVVRQALARHSERRLMLLRREDQAERGASGGEDAAVGVSNDDDEVEHADAASTGRGLTSHSNITRSSDALALLGRLNHVSTDSGDTAFTVKTNEGFFY